MARRFAMDDELHEGSKQITFDGQLRDISSRFDDYEPEEPDSCEKCGAIDATTKPGRKAALCWQCHAVADGTERKLQQ